MTDKEALQILDDPFLWDDLAESYEDIELREALFIAVTNLRSKVDALQDSAD